MIIVVVNVYVDISHIRGLKTLRQLTCINCSLISIFNMKMIIIVNNQLVHLKKNELKTTTRILFLITSVDSVKSNVTSLFRNIDTLYII